MVKSGGSSGSELMICEMKDTRYEMLEKDENIITTEGTEAWRTEKCDGIVKGSG